MVITKKQLKEYLDGNYDVTFGIIVEELKSEEEDYPKIKKFLEQLEKEGWIEKAFCPEHKTYEYDPGKEQGN